MLAESNHAPVEGDVVERCITSIISGAAQTGTLDDGDCGERRERNWGQAVLLSFPRMRREVEGIGFQNVRPGEGCAVGDFVR